MQNFDFFSFADFALSVSEVNQQVKDLLESDPVLEDISVKGEISNLSRPVSGHVYFTLKDEKSSLKCVMWRAVAAEFQELFKNGAAVIVHGRIGVYERDGLYQLYADAVYPVGRGKLFEEFLRLKEKLEKEGLFDSGRKKPLPYMPERIGVVTSSSGAAIQDIFNTIQKRWPLAEIYLSPASVQGEDAPAELIKAYKKLVEMKPDVILIARGGGSLEDLWAFNDETLVRTIASSKIPVISGVGHETDFTLLDFADDFRASTPTAAAVAATPDRLEIIQAVDFLTVKMNRLMREKLDKTAEKLNQLNRRFELAAPLNQIRQEQKILEQIHIRLNLWADRYFKQQRELLIGLSRRLESAGPSSVLNRGYAVIEDENGKIIVSASCFYSDEKVTIRMKDGDRDAKIL